MHDAATIDVASLPQRDRWPLRCNLDYIMGAALHAAAIPQIAKLDCILHYFDVIQSEVETIIPLVPSEKKANHGDKHVRVISYHRNVLHDDAKLLTDQVGDARIFLTMYYAVLLIFNMYQCIAVA